MCIHVGVCMSVNITVRIPRGLAERMKKHKEINWSEVVRRSIEEYLRRLEEVKRLETPAELLEELHGLGVGVEDLEPLPPDTEEKYYREMVAEEWRRVRSTTRAR